ncbi:MAG: type II toxin-antitoxin system VapC family toxin [Cyanobium sp. CZS 25K]|nr:type II toxin-antitoxin system VapC family toxin [Cyanobium sp. CZS25K]
MNITADSNVLARALVGDDPAQAAEATRVLREASTIAVPLPVLCELVWVLKRVYGFAVADIAAAIRSLLAAGNVQLDRQAVEAGLALLEAGGDFADGVIAHQGQWLGGETFVSFDRQAVALLRDQGVATQLLVAA